MIYHKIQHSHYYNLMWIGQLIKTNPIHTRLRQFTGITTCKSGSQFQQSHFKVRPSLDWQSFSTHKRFNQKQYPPHYKRFNQNNISKKFRSTEQTSTSYRKFIVNVSEPTIIPSTINRIQIKDRSYFCNKTKQAQSKHNTSIIIYKFCSLKFHLLPSTCKIWQKQEKLTQLERR